jgi:polyribonucleotide nucleotidyltransferase
MKAELKKLIGADIAAAYKLTDKSARSNALNDVRAKAKACTPKPMARRDGRDQADQEAGSRNRARRHPQGRPAHRRPHHAGPPDRIDGRFPAAHPRFGAVHARRNPAICTTTLGTKDAEQMIDGLDGLSYRTSCCTTTSPYSVGEVGRFGAPVVAKSATASWPGAR